MKDIDPVEELHRIRQRICKKAGGTPAAYARYYLELDREKVAADKAAGGNGVHAKRARKPAARRKAVTA